MHIEDKQFITNSLIKKLEHSSNELNENLKGWTLIKKDALLSLEVIIPDHLAEYTLKILINNTLEYF